MISVNPKDLPLFNGIGEYADGARRLRALIRRVLAEKDNDPQRAIGAIQVEACRHPEMLTALIGYELIRAGLMAYASKIALARAEGKSEADIWPEPFTVSEDDEAQSDSERQASSRPSSSDPQTEGEHIVTMSAAAPIAQPSAHNSEGDEALQSYERQKTFRPSSSDQVPGAAHNVDVSAEQGFAPPPAAKPRVTPEDYRTYALTKPPSVFETYKLRDGFDLGGLPWCKIPTISRQNRDEAELLDRIYGYAQPSDSGAKIRDIIPLAEVEKIIKEIAEKNGGH
jgi:hypothetical protein